MAGRRKLRYASKYASDALMAGAGTPEETRQFGKYLIDTLGPTGYIYCSSNSITPYVKPENYRAMIETLLEYG